MVNQFLFLVVTMVIYIYEHNNSRTDIIEIRIYKVKIQHAKCKIAFLSLFNEMKQNKSILAYKPTSKQVNLNFRVHIIYCTSGYIWPIPKYLAYDAYNLSKLKIVYKDKAEVL